MTSTLSAADSAVVVVDNARDAWDNRSSDADPLSYLDQSFVAEYRSALDSVAYAAMEQPLAEVWADEGYRVEFTPVARRRRPRNRTYFEMWDRAVIRLDPFALADAAHLSDVLGRWTER